MFVRLIKQLKTSLKKKNNDTSQKEGCITKKNNDSIRK
jgi:hypothetical protein